MDTQSIAVIGFGYIGATIGAILASKGYRVNGIEKSPEIIAKIESGKSPFNEPGLEELISESVQDGNLSITNEMNKISNVKTIIVLVGTPLTKLGDPDLSQIEKVCLSMQEFLSDDQLIIFKSTFPPGTTEDLCKRILPKDKNLMVAYSPVRIAEGCAIEEFLSIPIVVGGIDERSKKEAINFWQSTLGVDVIPVSSITTAEMVKLADNLWIDLNIALAVEVASLCDYLPQKMNALEVIRAAHTLPKGQHLVNILEPSIGVGGSCLTKDSWFVHNIGKNLGIKLQTPVTARTVNENIPYYSFSRIIDYFQKKGVGLQSIRFTFLGLAFKSNTGDCRFTPVTEIINHLRQTGVTDISIFDPLVSKKEAESLGIVLADDLDQALEGSDCAIFATGHDEFKKISPEYLTKKMSPDGLIFDGRNVLSENFIAVLEERGFSYRAVGR